MRGRRCVRRGRALASASPQPKIQGRRAGADGEHLDSGLQEHFERQLGHDFSAVRILRSQAASASADALGAVAYTIGSQVRLGSRAPGLDTGAGRWMLGHELAHVVQQRQARPAPGIWIAPAAGAAEREADAAGAAAAFGLGPTPIAEAAPAPVQRTVKVEDPAKVIPNPGGKGVKQTNAATVQGYLGKLCKDGSPTVDAKTGTVGVAKDFCTPQTVNVPFIGPLTTSPAQVASTATGCTCLCDMVASKNAWRIVVDDANWPHTLFDNNADAKKPGGTGGKVTTPSPNSPKLWGAATTTGKELEIDPWLVLGHELCGHGWLGDRGQHGPDEAQPRGEGGHQATVARENLLRAEHGIELRGTFKQPHCGESFWKDKKKPAKVNWSSFRSVCEAWRKAYNAKHGTSFKITDTIP